MLVDIVLDIPTRALNTPFTYEFPPTLLKEKEGRSEYVHTGDVAIVELGNRNVIGYVVGVDPDGMPDEKTKPVLAYFPESLFDDTSVKIARWMAQHYATPLSEALGLFIPVGLSARLKKALTAYNTTGEAKLPARRRRSPSHENEYAGASAAAPRPKHLTSGQVEALAAIRAALATAVSIPKVIPESAEIRNTIVLEGVTGSGKTEVYLRAIEDLAKRGKTAIMLVPEISLTPQTVGRFRARFGDRIAVLHSRLSEGERYSQWERIRTGDAQIVIGARSALFAPVRNLGLIVIDEEHDRSYKNHGAPRYHAREVAEYLAGQRSAVLVLGTATPSMEALHRAHSGDYTLVRMPERVGGALLPPVQIVDLTAEFADGNRSVFSRALQEALAEVRQHKEKALLFLNRRGFAQFLLCRECGFVPQCQSCSTSLTYHASTHKLRCHQCNAIHDVPAVCPMCGSPYLRQFGTGTQRVETEFQQLFPDWPVVRMDADTTTSKHAHAELLAQFEQLETGVLLGTQMVAKGLDFPEVTLVGVITADVTLNLPDFRSGERTFQLLEQVAGRAGRGKHPGKVIVQTYWPTHRAVRAAAAHNPALFHDTEREERAKLVYPPFGSLCNLVVSAHDEEATRSYAEKLAEALRRRTELADAQILGPAPCALARRKKLWRQHILIKGKAGLEVGPAVMDVLTSLSKPRAKDLRVSVDVDPDDLM
ncbi:MAG: primosomal protein N' [Actinomycetes bacterium]|nr:primosomal protein N' [Actinomycetes bacterium]